MRRRLLYTIPALVIGIVIGATGVALVAAQVIPPFFERPATFPSVISYQGTLSNSREGPIKDGSHTLIFHLYTSESSLTPEWTERHSVTTTDGKFSVMLGSRTSFPRALFRDNLALYLGVQVDEGREMTPRQQLTGVPFAFHSQNADLLDGKSSGAFAERDHAHDADSGSLCGLEWRFRGASEKFAISDVCRPIHEIENAISPVMALGADGLPVIAYWGSSAGQGVALKVAHCLDVECAAFNTVSVNDGIDLGSFPYTNGVRLSLAINSDGFPVVSYFYPDSQDLRVANCEDPNCVSRTIVTVDSEGDVGRHSSIAVGSDGFPVIAYRDASANRGRLKVAHCLDVACESATTTRVLGQPIGDASANSELASDGTVEGGSFTSISIAGDGLPVIGYRLGFNQRVMFAKCNDLACNSAKVNRFAIQVGSTTAMAIGQDGFPIMSWHVPSASNDLGTMHARVCGNFTCENIRGVVSVSDAANFQSIGVSPEGLPLFVNAADFQLADSPGLWLLRCNDDACESKTRTNLFNESTSGHFNSVVVLPDGNLIVASIDNANRLKVLSCLDC